VGWKASRDGRSKEEENGWPRGKTGERGNTGRRKTRPFTKRHANGAKGTETLLKDLQAIGGQSDAPRLKREKKREKQHEKRRERSHRDYPERWRGKGLKREAKRPSAKLKVREKGKTELGAGKKHEKRVQRPQQAPKRMEGQQTLPWVQGKHATERKKHIPM